jgi:hypothetical protein
MLYIIININIVIILIIIFETFRTKPEIIARLKFCRVLIVGFETGDIRGRGKKNAYTPGEKLVVRLRLRCHDDTAADDDDSSSNNNKLGSKKLINVYIFSGDRIKVRDSKFVAVALKEKLLVYKELPMFRWNLVPSS